VKYVVQKIGGDEDANAQWYRGTQIAAKAGSFCMSKPAGCG